MAIQTVAEAAMVVRPDFTSTAGAVRAGARRVGDQAGREMGGGFGGSFQSSMKSYASRAAGTMSILTAAVTGAGLSGLLTFGIKSAAALEQAQIGFETLLGSGKKAQTFLTELQKFAASTPFELPGLIDASRTLLGVGVSSKQVIPLLTAFGDTAGAVGVGQEQFQRIMVATSQAISAGKFQAGDLNQIMNNGIPIWSILAKATGKPVPELRKLSSAGKLLSKDVLPALQREMEKDYGGAMARQSLTLAGVWSTLKDSVAIGLAGALKPLVPLLSDLIPKAAAAAGTGLAVVSQVIVAMISAFRDGKTSSGGFIGVLQSVAIVAKDLFPLLIHGAQQAGVALGNAYTRIAAVVGPVVAWFNEHRTAAKALAAVILGFVAVVKVYEAALFVSTLTTGGWTFATNAAKVAQAGWTAISWLAVAPMHAHTLATAVSTSTMGTWIGVKWIELSAWVRTTAASVASTAAMVGQRVAMLASTAVTKAAAFATAAWSVTTKAAALSGTIFTAVMKGVRIVMATAFGPISIIIGLIALLTAGVIYAYKHNETFRKIVDAVWKAIKVAIGAVVTWFTGTIIPSFKVAINQMVTAFNFLSRIGKVVFNAVRTYVQTNIDAVMSIFNKLKSWITVTLPNAFKSGVSAIGKFWKGLQELARVPVAFVVNSVINPFLGGFQRVAGLFGVKTPSPITGFAEGGQIPGPASDRDNRLAWLKNSAGKTIGTLAVATGEFVVNAKDTARALPLLRWINDGMKDGDVSRRLGRPLTNRPGDGSEGWAFAGGGLVGFLKDVWGAISNPGALIRKPIEAALSGIPGGGFVKDWLLGMGQKLLSGFTNWLTGAGGTGGANVGKAQGFVKAQAGKPYIWAAAGPNGYDCSGIVSAVYNVLHGKNPYNHTFSTESLPNGFFPKPGPGGALTAGWAHPGERGASANVGHMAGQVGGLPFSSTGSRGVQVGGAADRVTNFAHMGHYASGGMIQMANIAKVSQADFGSVMLAPGNNLVYNGLGRAEPLVDPTLPAIAGGFDQPGARMHPDDIRALAEAIGVVVGGNITGTVGLVRTAARQAGRSGR